MFLPPLQELFFYFTLLLLSEKEFGGNKMKIRYAVEMNTGQNKLPGFYSQIIKDIASNINVIDRDKELFIVENKEEFQWLKEYFLAKNIWEESYVLIEIENPALTDLFSDYGFKSSNGTYYLYLDLVSAFTIISGELESKKMALYQIEEHLVAQECNDHTIYFIDVHQKDLIHKYAAAYDMKVSFFDLDKCLEKD
jgi:hypothetical protein